MLKSFAYTATFRCCVHEFMPVTQLQCNTYPEIEVYVKADFRIFILKVKSFKNVS